MSHCSAPTGNADQPAAEADAPVTHISTSWIRLASRRRTRRAEPLPTPNVRDRAA